MADSGKMSVSEIEAMIAKLRTQGISVGDAPAEQSKTLEASSETVRYLPDEVTDTVTEGTPLNKKKTSAATAAGSKRKKPASSQVPTRKSRRTTKAQTPVIKEENPAPEAEEEGFLKGRVVIPEMTIDRIFMAKHQLVEVSDFLIAQRWDHLFREEVLMDESKVREFYSEFKLEEMNGKPVATFVIGGVGQVFTSRELANLLGVPASGYDKYVKGIWPESVAKGEVIRRVGEDPSNASHQGKAAKLSLINRILHKLICTSITPRAQKHEVVNYQDFLLLDKLKEKTPVNLPMLILKHMERAAGSKTHGLPYPGIVKKILVELGIYRPEIESQLSTALGEQTVASWNWKFVEKTGWQNDHYAPAPAVEETPLEDDPLDLQQAIPAMESPAVIEVLKGLCEKIDVLSGKVARIESMIEKKSGGPEIAWVSEVRSKVEALESLPTLLKDIEESVKINMVHGTQIRDEIVELNRQLRFVGTELVEQLKLLVVKD